MALPIKSFRGKLCGKSAYDYTSQLDYGLETYKERKELVDKIMQNDDFFVDYFTNWHKTHPNKEDFLSSERNVCIALEKIADYLLFSPDIKENNKVNYVFYEDADLIEKIEKEKSTEGMSDTIGDDKFENTIMMVIDKGKNYKKEVKQSIAKNDFHDADFTTLVVYKNEKTDDEYFTFNNYLEDYQKVVNYFSSLFREGEIESYRQGAIIKQLMQDCKYDAIILKDKIKGTIYYNHCLPESSQPDLWLVNFTDISHIMALLKSTNTNLLTDMGVVTYDLQQLLEKIKLKDYEKEILNMWRKEDMTQESISEELDVSQQYISKVLKQICIRVMKTYKSQYEDWLYLNYLRGEYKTCSGCGQVKLVSKFHWDKTNDNYKNLCKKCIKEKNGCNKVQ